MKIWRDTVLILLLGAGWVMGSTQEPYLVVLGTAQDAGYPQVGCAKSCCERVWSGKADPEPVVSLGIVDPSGNRSWLMEATPDLPRQWMALTELAPVAGIFLTHAHIGHYTGLMYLGREVMGATAVPVYVMPRMAAFLATNGPWSQLVQLGNICLHPLEADRPERLNGELSVTPIRVPHRDEYSETVGYLISGPARSALFIPDIDKWSRWDRDLTAELAEVDLAFLDATFFTTDELPGRDMSEIPHPFVVETMDRLADLPAEERAKVHFIHFNHTNPLLDPDSAASRKVQEAGFRIARTGQRFGL